MWLKLLYIGLSIFFVWQLFIYLNNNPGALAKKNVSKTIFILGTLALGLIGFISLLVYMLKK